MPEPRLPMRKVRDVLRLSAACMSKRKIVASCREVFLALAPDLLYRERRWRCLFRSIRDPAHPVPNLDAGPAWLAEQRDGAGEPTNVATHSDATASGRRRRLARLLSRCCHRGLQ